MTQTTPTNAKGNEMTTYYRVHAASAPAFSADNAWSAPWGSSFISPRFYVADNGEEDTGWAVVTLNVVPAIVEEFVVARCNVEYRGGSVMIVVSDDDIDSVCDLLDDDESVGWYETEIAVEANRGYSCCDSEEKLARYLAAGGELIAFEGEVIGRGEDGEWLVVPTAVVGRTSL